MKEAYETLQIDIREIPEEDVITVSGINDGPSLFSAHDNSFIDWTVFM